MPENEPVDLKSVIKSMPDIELPQFTEWLITERYRVQADKLQVKMPRGNFMPADGRKIRSVWDEEGSVIPSHTDPQEVEKRLALVGLFGGNDGAVTFVGPDGRYWVGPESNKNIQALEGADYRKGNVGNIMNADCILVDPELQKEWQELFISPGEITSISEEEILKRVNKNANSDSFDPKAFLEDVRILYRMGKLNVGYDEKTDEIKIPETLRFLWAVNQQHQKAIFNKQIEMSEDEVLGRIHLTLEEKEETSHLYSLLASSEERLQRQAHQEALFRRLKRGEPITVVSYETIPRQRKEEPSLFSPKKFEGKYGKVIADRELGSGAIGTVYAGKYEGENRYSVAVKVEKSGFKNALPNFDDEFEILIRMASYSQQNKLPLHFPTPHSFHRGTNPITDPSYIVMDLVRGFRVSNIVDYPKYRFFKLGGEGGEIVGEGLEERLALEITRQLVEALELSRAVGYHNRETLKGTFWDPEQQHLTILDWNVIEKATEENLREELADVGSSLSICLVGKGPDKRYLPLEEHKYWGILRQATSLGTQAILRKSFNPDESERYADLTSLRKDIEKQIEKLQG